MDADYGASATPRTRDTVVRRARMLIRQPGGPTAASWRTDGVPRRSETFFRARGVSSRRKDDVGRVLAGRVRAGGRVVIRSRGREGRPGMSGCCNRRRFLKGNGPRPGRARWSPTGGSRGGGTSGLSIGPHIPEAAASAPSRSCTRTTRSSSNPHRERRLTCRFRLASAGQACSRCSGNSYRPASPAAAGGRVGASDAGLYGPSRRMLAVHGAARDNSGWPATRDAGA